MSKVRKPGTEKQCGCQVTGPDETGELRKKLVWKNPWGWSENCLALLSPLAGHDLFEVEKALADLNGVLKC